MKCAGTPRRYGRDTDIDAIIRARHPNDSAPWLKNPEIGLGTARMAASRLLP